MGHKDLSKFEVLIRAIGGNEKGEEGKGHGTVVVFTPVSPPLCSPASLMSESFEPEPLTRQWCMWELFVTMKTGTRLTVVVPRKHARPREICVDTRGAKCKGVEAQLIRRVVEVQATMEVDAKLDFADVDDFVREAFRCEGRGAVRPLAFAVRELAVSTDSTSLTRGGYGTLTTPAGSKEEPRRWTPRVMRSASLANRDSSVPLLASGNRPAAPTI